MSSKEFTCLLCVILGLSLLFSLLCFIYFYNLIDEMKQKKKETERRELLEDIAREIEKELKENKDETKIQEKEK